MKLKRLKINWKLFLDTLGYFVAFICLLCIGIIFIVTKNFESAIILFIVAIFSLSGMVYSLYNNICICMLEHKLFELEKLRREERERICKNESRN